MSDLLFEKRAHIAYLTLNRPERRNTYSCELIVKLAAAWQEIRDDRDLRGVVLTGAGTEAFSAGGDLKYFIPFLTGAKKPETEYEHSIVKDMSQVLTALLRPFGFAAGLIKLKVFTLKRRMFIPQQSSNNLHAFGKSIHALLHR